MIQTQFKPFSDRLSRDIRNELSASFLITIKTGNLDSAHEAAAHYLRDTLEDCYRDYIENRLLRYAQILATLNARQASRPLLDQDPLFIGLLLWDEELFFEVHEVLEHAWLRAEGEEKSFLQAMIRAAGAYVKAEAYQMEAAEKMAEKSLHILANCKARLRCYTDPELLLTALADLSEPPPKLLIKTSP